MQVKSVPINIFSHSDVDDARELDCRDYYYYYYY